MHSVWEAKALDEYSGHVFLCPCWVAIAVKMFILVAIGTEYKVQPTESGNAALYER